MENIRTKGNYVSWVWGNKKVAIYEGMNDIGGDVHWKVIIMEIIFVNIVEDEVM